MPEAKSVNTQSIKNLRRTFFNNGPQIGKVKSTLKTDMGTKSLRFGLRLHEAEAFKAKALLWLHDTAKSFGFPLASWFTVLSVTLAIGGCIGVYRRVHSHLVVGISCLIQQAVTGTCRSSNLGRWSRSRLLLTTLHRSAKWHKFTPTGLVIITLHWQKLPTSMKMFRQIDFWATCPPGQAGFFV